MLLCALLLRIVTCFLIGFAHANEFESDLSFALYQVIFFELPFYFLVWISYILSFGWLSIKWIFEGLSAGTIGDKEDVKVIEFKVKKIYNVSTVLFVVVLIVQLAISI